MKDKNEILNEKIKDKKEREEIKIKKTNRQRNKNNKK